MIRRPTLLFVLLLALAPATAFAGGINLSWDDCGAAGLSQQNFACNSNSGTPFTLVISAIPNLAMAELNGAECTLIVTGVAATLPSWWQMQSGGCRQGSLTTNSDFVAGPFTCSDPWEGQAFNGQVFDYPVAGFSPGQGRIRTIQAMNGSVFTAVNNTTELYILKVRIGRARTIGLGSCAGCSDGACILLSKVDLLNPGATIRQSITTPALHQHALWQNGGAIAGGCPGATPARAPTWGAVKGMYR